jgi:MarR family transcriptional regulator, organic hydroperoxide resistance regulator
MENDHICVHFLLGKALQRVNQVSKSKLSPYGVTPVQYALLKMLWKKDGQFGFELAHKLMLDSATITGIIDRLEQNRLVERRADPKDRRNRLVFLTEKGRALESPLSEKMEEMNKEVLAGFNEEETLQFKQTLFDIGINSKNKGS